MFDIYAKTFMTAARQRPCVRVKAERRQWWLRGQTRCIDLDKL